MKWCASILVMTMLAAPAWAGPVDDLAERARQANLRGDTVTALAIYGRLADDGRAEGMVALGQMYATGRGVGRNPIRACDYYQQAAERGLVLAQSLLAECYLQGHGRPQDYGQSRAWYERAALLGDQKAACAVGRFYMQGWGVDRDLDRGIALCDGAATVGDAQSQVDLGRAYLEKDRSQFQARAFDLFLNAARQGSADGALELGLMRWNGAATQADRSEAARCFLAAWEGRDARAPFLLGQYYFSLVTTEAERERRKQEKKLGREKSLGLQAMYWLSIAYKLDPAPANQALSMRMVKQLDQIIPGLTDELDAWLRTNKTPPPIPDAVADPVAACGAVSRLPTAAADGQRG